MPTGYLIAQVTVTDPEAFARYAKAAGELLRAWGARPLVDPNTAIVVAGVPKKRTVIFEFDGLGLAKGFWEARNTKKPKRSGWTRRKPISS